MISTQALDTTRRNGEEEAGTYVFPGEQPTSKRTVRDDRRPELSCGLEQPNLLVLDVEREGGVLDLEGRNGVHRVCAPERLGGALGEAEMLHLALSVDDVSRASRRGRVATHFTSWAIASTVFSIGMVGSGLQAQSYEMDNYAEETCQTHRWK